MLNTYKLAMIICVLQEVQVHLVMKSVRCFILQACAPGKQAEYQDGPPQDESPLPFVIVFVDCILAAGRGHHLQAVQDT